MIKQTKENQQESRREWLLWIFKQVGQKRENIETYQVWQHHNQPIEIYSQKCFDEKLNYIHPNPVSSGFVCKPWAWK
ncbi:MAG: transposase [Lonepinella koalarum]|nr:transposase [Lonepinella koalarum]